jgi:hypothetical protein
MGAFRLGAEGRAEVSFVAIGLGFHAPERGKLRAGGRRSRRNAWDAAAAAAKREIADRALTVGFVNGPGQVSGTVDAPEQDFEARFSK